MLLRAKALGSAGAEIFSGALAAGGKGSGASGGMVAVGALGALGAGGGVSQPLSSAKVAMAMAKPRGVKNLRTVGKRGVMVGPCPWHTLH